MMFKKKNVAYLCCAIHVISEFTSSLPLFLLLHSTEKRGKSSIPRVRLETTITVLQQSKRAFACVLSATVVSASVPPRPSWKARCGSCTVTWQDKGPGAIPSLQHHTKCHSNHARITWFVTAWEQPMREQRASSKIWPHIVNILWK